MWGAGNCVLRQLIIVSLHLLHYRRSHFRRANMREPIESASALTAERGSKRLLLGVTRGCLVAWAHNTMIDCGLTLQRNYGQERLHKVELRMILSTCYARGGAACVSVAYLHSIASVFSMDDSRNLQVGRPTLYDATY